MTDRVRTLARVAAFMALLAASARLSIPFWPAPLSLQTLILALIGLSLGPWHGLSAVGLYIFLGVLVGLPILANPPYGGPGYVFLPGFGFLLGFLPSVVVTGLAGRMDRFLPRLVAYTAAALLGLIPVHLCGILYYGMIKGVYGQAPVWAILAPFAVYLPGDLLKAVIAAVVRRNLPLDPPSSGSRSASADRRFPRDCRPGPPGTPPLADPRRKP